jgi:hypothetical protein
VTFRFYFKIIIRNWKLNRDNPSTFLQDQLDMTINYVMLIVLWWFWNKIEISQTHSRFVLTYILSSKIIIFGLCFVLYFLKLSAGIGVLHDYAQWGLYCYCLINISFSLESNTIYTVVIVVIHGFHFKKEYSYIN